VQRNVHFVAPSLHGWGHSDPIPNLSNYSRTLAADITALITHLHPDLQDLQLYICAHCFGTVGAQILYGLDYDIFPLGRYINAIILVSPYSPPHIHLEYYRTLSWQLFFVAGPPTRYVPYNLISRIFKCFITSRIKSIAETEAVMRNFLFDHMSEEEGEAFSRWRENHGVGEGELEKIMAKKNREERCTDVARILRYSHYLSFWLPVAFTQAWGRRQGKTTYTYTMRQGRSNHSCCDGRMACCNVRSFSNS